MTIEAALKRENWTLVGRNLIAPPLPKVELGIVCRNNVYGEVRAPMDYLPEHGSHWRKIINEVARQRKVPASYIIGKRRWRPVSEARAECYFRIKTEVKNKKGQPVTWYQIAKWMGRNDSTVYQMFYRHADRMARAQSAA